MLSSGNSIPPTLASTPTVSYLQVCIKDVVVEAVNPWEERFCHWCWVWEYSVQFSCPAMYQLFATQWTAAHQASLSITNSRSLLKLMSIELVMPSNHLILCRPFLLPSILASIRVFSNESALRIRWPKYWGFSFNISPSNKYSGLIFLGWNGWISFSARDSQESSPTTLFKSINFSVLSFLYSPTLTSVHDYWENHSLD